MKYLLLFILFFNINYSSLDMIEKLLHKSDKLIKQEKYRKALDPLIVSLDENKRKFPNNRLVMRLRNKMAEIYLLNDNDAPAIELLEINMKFLLNHPQNIDNEIWTYFLLMGDKFYKIKYIKSALKIYEWIFNAMTKIKQKQIRFVTSYDESVLLWARLAIARSYVDLDQYDKAWEIISIINGKEDPLFQYIKGRILFSWPLKLNRKEAYVLLKKAAFNGVGEAIYFLAYQFSNKIKKNPKATFFWYKILSFYLQGTSRLKRFGLSCFNENNLLKEAKRKLNKAEELLSSKYLKFVYKTSRDSFNNIKIQINANNLKYVDSSDTEAPKSAKQLITCFEKQRKLFGSLIMYQIDREKKLIINSYVDQDILVKNKYIKKIYYDNFKDRYRSDQLSNFWCITHGPFQKKCDSSLDTDPNCHLSLELQKATLTHLKNSPLIKKYFFSHDSFICHNHQAVVFGALKSFQKKYSSNLKLNGTKFAYLQLIEKKLLGNIPKHPQDELWKVLYSDLQDNIWCNQHGPYRLTCKNETKDCVRSLFKYTEIMSLKSE
ncbi:MAG: hypothetical protein COB02_12855 [Candidatus Cloacimonadota bacterium]|nr:MAG: hypothetical protein COB02_12855 [Candidatus Cloacimonadota bacterium]